MKELDEFDWLEIESALDVEGQAVLPGLLSAAECDALAALHAKELPSLQELRAKLYERLAPTANRWNRTMGLASRYPARLDQLQQACCKANQHRPQSAIHRLREGAHRGLHQNAEGHCVFPLQAELELTQPGKDFTGGELVMTEQRPRMQTRPMVVPIQKGDAAVFAVHHRPFRGTRGYYRVNLRHAVSRVLSGERVAVDLIFHDEP